MFKHLCYIGVAIIAVLVLPAGPQRPVSLAAAPQSPPAQQPAGGRPNPLSRALIDGYCVGCHNERLKRGDLVLDGLGVDVAAQGAIWEKVVRKLRSGTMPPAGSKRPSAAEVRAFVSVLEAALDTHARNSPNPGRPALHRLNRTEYANAVRDLLGLTVDGSELLPADDSGYGFDNIADVLTVSPALLERYVSAAQKISRLAIRDPTLRPRENVYKIPFAFVQDDRMSDELPFGSRGGAAVRHYFPTDGEYVLRLRLQRPGQNRNIRGFNEPNQIDIRIDGSLLTRFTVGDKGLTELKEGTPGYGNDKAATLDSGMEVRFPAEAGEHVVGVFFMRRSSEYEGVGPARLPVGSWGYANAANTSVSSGAIEMAIDTITIAGPFVRTADVRRARLPKWWTCASPEDERCVSAAVATLARHAFRRPATKADISRLLMAYQRAAKDAGMLGRARAVLEAVLSDPEFIFRIERDPPGAKAGAVYRISDLELASRLSFFLWSSIPDDELLQLAEARKLAAPGVLEVQVRRMLADRRSSALVSNFSGQWLYLRNVLGLRPDSKLFPEFDENLRAAFEQETTLFLESQLRENRSVLDLLTANYTYVNERLARHYGIPGIRGTHFRRVTFKDERRAGLLGHGSILSVTSYANRTSPVKRGQWMLQNILGTPPPPPPPEVPPFPEEGPSATLSVRARMEQHRKNPACAACHAQIDPLGFALENFDAVGKWRVTEAGQPIDASGHLPNGAPFQDPAAFRKLLVTQADGFVATVIEKLMTYGVGRGLEYYDMPAVRQVARGAAPGYRWSDVITGIVKSPVFTMRRAQQ